MADSAIQWTDKVWNPTVGCTRVSAGCENCYAEKFANRLEGMGRPEYLGLTKKHADRSVNWTGVVRTLPERLEDPLRWKKPQRVFVNSMSDLFHESVPDEFIDQVFAVMAHSNRHTYQVLTKRPERMLEWAKDASERVCRAAHWNPHAWHWPWENVWLGVSVENQAAADERIPLLLRTPAAVHFLSCEPLLGPLDLKLPPLSYQVSGRVGGTPETASAFRELAIAVTKQYGPPRIDWCIAGGESGGPPDRRLVMHLGDRMSGEIWTPKPEALDWLRSIRDQCQAAGTAFFYKQAGGPTPRSGGRLLDGRTWDEFPDTKGA